MHAATAMAADKMVPNLQVLLAQFFLCLSTTASLDDRSFPVKLGSSTPHAYTRSAAVKRHCRSVLSSAADADRSPFQMDALSFTNGDWIQDAGDAPLLPFQGSYADAAAGSHQQLEAVNLASFTLTHMEKAPWRGAGAAAVNASGLLTLAVTRNCCCSSMEPRGPDAAPEFVLRPGVAKLHIRFEGVYTETRPSDGGGDGERVLCMVGNGVLPVHDVRNGSDPWDWAKNDGGGGVSAEAPVVADDNILLVLQYPKTRTLATRAVRGEMTSTSRPKSGGAYFDRIRLVSTLHRYYSRYRFRRGDEEPDLAAGCGTLRDGDAAGQLFRGSGAAFCDILGQFAPQDYGVMDAIRNCDSTDAFCSPFGPFETSTISTVAVQGLECEPDGAAGDARVAAVFRLLQPGDHQPTAAKRTGLGGAATLSAEGAWSAATGRLCMAACGGVGKDEAACRHRVTLYVPTTFSATRRAILVGRITAVDDGTHSPISFRQLVSPRHHWQQFVRPGEPRRVPVAYSYTKIKQAVDLLERSGPSGFRDNFIAKSFLSYPKLACAADDMASLSNLGEDLGLRFRLVPKPQFVPEGIEKPFFQLQILSIGSLVGSYLPPYEQQQQQRGEPGMRFEQLNNRRHGVEKQGVLMNVSAEFSAPSWKFFDTRQIMSLEGVYNPESGRMHLVGCRDVNDAPRPVVSSKSRGDLEDGMDCSIEVKVEYPPTTTRWLVSPVAKVSVASRRDAADPLHFPRTEIRSLPITYRDHRNNEPMMEQRVEGLLCVAVLSATVSATVIQLRHVESRPDVAPFVSLAALGVQALGYAATLVADARTLPAWPTTSRHGWPYADDRVQWGLDRAAKALALAALLLTARLARKVRRARARAPLEPARVPSDGAVLLYSSVVYLGLAAHGLMSTSSRTPPPGGMSYSYVEYQQAHQGSSASSWRMHRWSAVVEQCFGVAKEWFLLPQVIGNAVWRVNCKPLAARYYAGVTAAWLLPHVYGYLRPPVVNPDEPAQLHGALDLYSSTAVAVGFPVVGVVLALAVYVQQRWNYRIVCRVMKGRQNKLQHVY